jgi:hypothetical protein
MSRFPFSIRYIYIVDYFLAFKRRGWVFGAVLRCIVGCVYVVCSHFNNVNVLMYVQLGKENPQNSQRKCVFTENLKAEYLFINEYQHEEKCSVPYANHYSL